MENKGEIYLITCLVTKKRYVGQTVCFQRCKNGKLVKSGTERRWKAHVSTALSNGKGCYALQKALQKYGAHNFTVKTILICELSKLDYFEHKMARTYNTYTPNGYNIKQCSSKGRHAEETKVKISLSNTGKVRDEDYKENMRKIKTIHTGLPKYIYYLQDRGKEGYRVMKHPTLKEKKFLANSLSMEQKLQQAISYVNLSVVPVNRPLFVREEDWREKVRETRQASQTLPEYIYFTNDNNRDMHGYKVRNHPTKKNKQFVSRKLTMKQKLRLAIEYVDSKE